MTTEERAAALYDEITGHPYTGANKRRLIGEAIDAAVAATLTSLAGRFRTLAQEHAEEGGQSAEAGRHYHAGQSKSFSDAVAIIEARMREGT